MLVCVVALALVSRAARADEAVEKRTTWIADNGNGTFTNPLFYDEFSDPDVIRVGEDYYLTGTTMHTMPGLPILHSRDLVNWRFVAYACDVLDFGPEYRLQGGEIYGRGIWAPCFRYHNGTYYIFSNVNGRKTQLFRAQKPEGPWTRNEMRSSLHDISVLFDDDGRAYAVWGYNEIMIGELEPDLLGIKPGTQRVLIAKGHGMGEGAHFYKIKGKYYLISTNYEPMGYMVCARADRLDGPWERVVLSARESFGTGTGWRLRGLGRDGGMDLVQPNPSSTGACAMHQGGIVETPTGEWWAISMMDANSVGRLSCLSPVTWSEGWPYYGLPGNLTRSPKTWVKPATGYSDTPAATFRRSDDFSGPALLPIWQWNHVPENGHWSLAEKPGALRLHTLPAPDFSRARNSLTQRAMGPESVATVTIDANGLQSADTAGLALLNFPYATLSIGRGDGGWAITWFDQRTGETRQTAVSAGRVYLRARCDFDRDVGQFSYSVDGKTFVPMGEEIVFPYQLKTFQGVRYALFAYTTGAKAGGFADFEDFQLEEPRADAVRREIPSGRTITLTSVADGCRVSAWNGLLRPRWDSAPAEQPLSEQFRVQDLGRGRVKLEAADGSGFVTVTGVGATGDVQLVKSPGDGDGAVFQWVDMLRGQVMLLSLKTNRYLTIAPHVGELASADAPGAAADRKEGACFSWSVVP
ncbi:glycoside hydrolase [Opitutaceae bacterium EW11]|nr:glycoside hydrolase [Opitutaceae bacterium EW11]